MVVQQVANLCPLDAGWGFKSLILRSLEDSPNGMAPDLKSGVGNHMGVQVSRLPFKCAIRYW